MKRVTAIAVAGAAILILSIGAYLALSRFLVPASSDFAAVTGAPSYAAPSMTVEAVPPSQEIEFEALLAEFGVVAPTTSEIAAAAGAPSSSAPSSTAPSTPQQSAFETVTLKVDGMWCASCSYIVRWGLSKIPGVVEAKVLARKGTAVVTFDPAEVDVATLIAATSKYGYPAQLLAQLDAKADRGARP